jgi:hypothetical protein
VESSLRLEAPVYQLFPLLEELEKDKSAVHKVYSKTPSLANADLALVPMSIPYLIQKGYRKALWSFLKSCEHEGIPVLIFSGGDYGMSLPFKNVITVRLGGFDSSLDENTFIMPPFIDDPYTVLNKEPSLLDLSIPPTIGFVGHSNGSLAKLFKEYFSFLKGNLQRLTGMDPTDSQNFYPSSSRRFRYLKMLEADSNLETNFIHRQKYRAGESKESGRTNTQKEFYLNMESNLYTFCIRGTGNFSARFYETLAMGRIPLVLDTDCRLPFGHRIDWVKHIVRVPEREVRQLSSHLLDFHETLAEESTWEIQQANRSLWEKFFQKDSFFLNLHDDLQSKLQI